MLLKKQKDSDNLYSPEPDNKYSDTYIQKHDYCCVD